MTLEIKQELTLVIGVALNIFLLRQATGWASKTQGPEMLVAIAGWLGMPTIVMMWLAETLLSLQSCKWPTPTFDVRDRRSGEAAKGTHKRSLWVDPLDGIFRITLHQETHLRREAAAQ